jgi:hypothetical protein
LQDRVLIFLTRLRRKTPFRELGYLYGCGKTSAQRYFEEIVDIWCEHVVDQLVFPRTPEELLAMSRKEVLDRFPHLLAILDATNWEELKAENFLLNRLSYSAYKHFNAFQVLLGKSPLRGVECHANMSCYLHSLVVSTERLILWRSQIFGGMSNEIDVLLDESSLFSDMEGLAL